MPDESDPRRDALHAFLQDAGPAGVEKQAVLVGWVVVMDWIDESGDRWLTKGHSASLPSWLASGLHHEALYGDWPAPSEDDDDA